MNTCASNESRAALNDIFFVYKFVITNRIGSNKIKSSLKPFYNNILIY